MGTIDEINAMKKEGKSEQEISDSLKQRGISEQEVRNAMSQAQIKNAVSSQGAEGGQEEGSYSMQAGSNEYRPSISAMDNMANQGGDSYSSGGQGGQEYVQGTPSPGGVEEYSSGGYPGPGGGAYGGEGYGGYSEYQDYQGGMSSDVITEIAEQIVSEKLSNVREQLEKAIDFRTGAEAKISNLNERLRRIEQILDRLQLSILQKMGDYVTDVKDIKKELEETQKSFKAMSHRKGHKKHP